MKIDETQTTVIYRLLLGIRNSIEESDTYDAHRLTCAAIDVMCGLSVKEERQKHQGAKQ